MPAPDPYVSNKCLGRTGTAEFFVEWDAQENNDLDAAVFLDPSRDLAGAYDNERIKVTKIFWQKATSAEVVVEFDTVEDRREILVLPEGEMRGEMSFLSNPDGCFPDPSTDSPSDVVVSTDGALSTDSLFIRMDYKVSGKHKP